MLLAVLDTPQPTRCSTLASEARRNKMTALLACVLGLNKKKRPGKLAPSKRDRLEREIAARDEEIDALVYVLYGITEAEREIIEAS